MAMVSSQTETAPKPPSKKRASGVAFRRAILSLLIGAAVWELLGRFVLSGGLLFAPFSDVLIVLYQSFASGEIWEHLRVSSIEFALGFGAAIIVGMFVGVLMGRFKVVYVYLDPWVSILYSSPLVALMPLYLLLFGVGLLSKVAIVFTVSVFPILLNTYTGIRSTDRHLVEVARSFSCSEIQIFKKIQFPSSLPFVITGIKLGLGRGLTGVVVGELFSSQAGVGYLIASAGQSFDAATVLMGVLIFTLAGLAMMLFLDWLGGYFAPWRVSMDSEQ